MSMSGWKMNGNVDTVKDHLRGIIKRKEKAIELLANSHSTARRNYLIDYIAGRDLEIEMNTNTIVKFFGETDFSLDSL